MLKVIMLRKKQDQLEKREAELRSKLAGYKQREDELAQAIADATEEDTSDIEAAVAELETNQADTKAELKKIRDDLDKVIGEIEDAEKAQEDALAGETGTGDDGEARSRRRSAQRFDVRAAAEFQRTGKRTIKDVRRFLRAAVLSSSTGVIGPTGVGGINDPVGGPSALIDLIKITDCTGMASYKVAVMTADATASQITTEGTAPTESEPTFAEVSFTPANFGTLAYVSKEIRKQSPLAYEEKVNESARRALRKKLTSVAAAAAIASDLNDSYALSAAASATTGAALFDQNLLSNIILAYGGDEGIDGQAVLFLNKADLKAFAAVRGTNEFLPVYSIIPDAATPSTGVIKDNNGLSCRYCLCSDVTALSTLTLATTAKKTMFYGNPQSIELGLWGGFDVAVSDEYKFAEGLLTVRGEVTGDVEVTVKNGVVVVTAKKASA